MKLIIKLMLIAFMVMSISCNEHPKAKLNKAIPQYTIGDVVYLKPDSTKVVIDDIYPECDPIEYSIVRYGISFRYKEPQIYGKE